MLINDINNSVIKCWYNQDVSTKVPLIYSEELKQNSLLFVGMNPSFSVKAYKSILRGTPYEQVHDLESYFSFENYTPEKQAAFSEIHKITKEKYHYFKKFKDLSNHIDCEWEHIDLLYMRDTNQKVVEKLFKRENLFIRQQLKITIDIINYLTPRIIVVENAFASKILKNELDLKWNNEIGTYLLNDSIPVFLSGMLTGGRALDLGSFERLKWHIKFILNQNN